jgi:hypothetical protein
MMMMSLNLKLQNFRLVKLLGILIAIAVLLLGFALQARADQGGIHLGTKNLRPFPFPKIIPDPKPLQILGPAGELFTFVKTGATTCGQYVMAESVVPPGEGPMPHIHHYTNEWFYFPDGGITIMHSDKTFPDLNVVPGENAPKVRFHLEETAPGSLYYGERYYVHGFTNTSDAPKRLVFIWTPDDPEVGITSYFKAVGQPVLDPAHPPSVNPKNRELFVTQAPKFGINQSTGFWKYINAVDYKFPKMDQHLSEFQALLAPDVENGPSRVACKPSAPIIEQAS